MPRTSRPTVGNAMNKRDSCSKDLRVLRTSERNSACVEAIGSVFPLQHGARLVAELLMLN